MTAHSAQGGIVVTSGVFTGEAEAFAAKTSVYLIDGTRLFEMIRAVQTQPAAAYPQAAAGQVAAAQARPAARSGGAPGLAPNVRRCPRCGGDLVLRMARRGNNAGSGFWGCENYPRCKYTEDYEG